MSEADDIQGSEVEFWLLELEGKEFVSRGSSKGRVDSCIGTGKGKTESVVNTGYLSAKGNIFS
jgi:hypothetical protein